MGPNLKKLIEESKGEDCLATAKKQYILNILLLDHGEALIVALDDFNYQFRKLALKERDMVRASDGGWVGVYSALAMCLDHIADAGKKVVEAQP